MNITIKPIDKASNEQTDAWIDLRHELWPEHSRAELADEVDQLGGSINVWLAYDGDKPVGFVEAGTRSVLEGSYDGPGGFVEGLFVSQDYRHHGLAKRLVGQVEDWARQQGYKQLGSNADLDNVASDAFHKAIGFTEVNRTINYLKDL
jgi:aminoglycoside 6'-N-acetyltransferase I